MSSYQDLPAGKPPPGVLPNFKDPPSLGPQVHLAMGLCIGVGGILMLLRFYVKAFIHRSWNWDDLLGVSLGRGLGLHIWDIRVIDFNKHYLQRDQVGVILFACATIFVKLSLILLYLRLFKPNLLTRSLIVGGLVVCSVFYGTTIIINCALCIPSPSGPDNDMAWLSKAQSCGAAESRLSLAQGVFGAISDLYLLSIPIQMVLRLHLTLKRKLGICAVFVIGVVAIACSGCSVAYRAISLGSYDSTWNGTYVFIFSNAELSAGIICACMPLLPSLINSATFAHQKVFQPPSRIRYYVSRVSLHTHSSSSDRGLAIPDSASRGRYGQDRKYTQTSSEQELSLELQPRDGGAERTGRFYHERYDRAPGDSRV